jgi:selenide,water dikinase
MISTVDFITPPVDDPYWFGQIAAANSISDIYSMGGRPLTALNLVMFPAKQLDTSVLKEILQGGHDKIVEAGACLAGGHSVEDDEPKYGLCVNGVVHPDRIITNAGSQPGDALILTKPLGTGVLFNAVRDRKFPYKDLEREVLPTVAALNGAAMETALKYNLHACTDITGFGIAGHVLEVALGSNARVILKYSDLPLYPGTLEMYRAGVSTGSNRTNKQMVRLKMEIQASLIGIEEELLYDPQTSGGLLLSVPLEQASDLISELNATCMYPAVKIGEITEGSAGITII